MARTRLMLSLAAGAALLAGAVAAQSYGYDGYGYDGYGAAYPAPYSTPAYQGYYQDQGYAGGAYSNQGHDPRQGGYQSYSYYESAPRAASRSAQAYRAPAPAYPADPTWGYGAVHGGVGEVTTRAYAATGAAASGYGYSSQPYAYYGSPYGHDRGGRYGYSAGYRAQDGYRDIYGYNDDRPVSRQPRVYDYRYRASGPVQTYRPQGSGYSYDYSYDYDRQYSWRQDCDCTVYYYDR